MDDWDNNDWVNNDWVNNDWVKIGWRAEVDLFIGIFIYQYLYLSVPCSINRPISKAAV